MATRADSRPGGGVSPRCRCARGSRRSTEQRESWTSPKVVCPSRGWMAAIPAGLGRQSSTRWSPCSSTWSSRGRRPGQAGAYRRNVGQSVPLPPQSMPTAVWLPCPVIRGRRGIADVMWTGPTSTRLTYGREDRASGQGAATVPITTSAHYPGRLSRRHSARSRPRDRRDSNGWSLELAEHQRGAELMTPIGHATLYLKFTASGDRVGSKVRSARVNRGRHWPSAREDGSRPADLQPHPACPAVEAKSSGPAEIPTTAVVTNKQKAATPPPGSAEHSSTYEHTGANGDQPRSTPRRKCRRRTNIPAGRQRW